MTEPLTPPDCDLRDYPWMPLDCTRLLTSETWILGSADEKVAALTLWCKSWHQVPAGSLPENDRMLEVLSEAGSRWTKVRDHALRGWVKCIDGRLYHPVVAEKANFSWALKLKQKARTQAARDALDAKRRAATGNIETPSTETVTASVTETATGSIRTEQIRSEQERKTPLDAPPHADAPRSASPPPRKVGTRLPDDWQPDEPGYAGVDVNRTLPRFRDYWRAKSGKAGVMLDWQATWRNWCRRDAEQPKPKLHTLPQHEQDRRILAAVGLRFDDPEPVVHIPTRIAQ